MLAEQAMSVPQLRADDHAGFARAVDLHKDALVNYLSLLCGCRSRAEDLAQETFLRLYLHVDRYQERGRLRSYLFRIATNLARSEQRRARRQQLLARALGLTGEPALPLDPYAALIEREELRALWRSLGRLPLRLRAPLLLFEVEGLSYPEIAQALGCSEGTVKSRLSRARARLRRGRGGGGDHGR